MDKNISGPSGEIVSFYAATGRKIRARLKEFSSLKEKGGFEPVFEELLFCLLTPQSKARSCWAAVEELRRQDLIRSGTEKNIAQVLKKRTRFHNNKARYIVEAREKKDDLNTLVFSKSEVFSKRDWLHKNIKGLGMKEASHFLRNIGYGEQIAILDRHILKNLKRLGIIEEIPASITKKNYLEIEKKFMRYSASIGIPPAALDLIFWAWQTGEIFK